MSTSFWLDRTESNLKKNFDVIVVGAGISGLSTAYWLEQEDPSLKIAILEKSRLGYGASGRNAGFVTCGSVEHFNRMIGKHGKDQAVDIWRFSEKNLQLLEEHIVQDQSELLQFEKKGAFSLAAHDAEFSELKSISKMMDEIGIPTKIYSAEEVTKSVGATNFAGGIRYLDDASVHPVRLLEAMGRKLKNTQLIEACEVYSYEATADGSRLVKTDLGHFECSMMVFALNGYSSQLSKFFEDKIFPTRGQILMMEKVPPFMDGPCYANFYLDYFRQLPTGELLIGGFRQIEKATEVGYSDHTTDVIQKALHDFVQTHLPAYFGKKVTHRWGGIMGFSKDGEPMIGALPEDNQIFFLGGYTGHGIGLAFNTGKTLTDLIFGREVPPWISAKRF
jgi:glycine/D-amino acid oxidase-like deaminating enzyme